MLSMMHYSGLQELPLTVFWAASPSSLDPASLPVQSLNNLHAVTLVIATIVCLVVCGLLIFSLVRVRRTFTSDFESERISQGSTALEVIWTAIPVGILAILLVLTYQTL